MRQTAFLHKLATRDPRALPAATVLELATLGGARVLGMDRQLGSLEPGKRADLLIVGMSQRAPDTALRSRLPPGLRHARRRCGDDDREREGADGEQDGADARRSGECWRRRGGCRRMCGGRWGGVEMQNAKAQCRMRTHSAGIRCRMHHAERPTDDRSPDRAPGPAHTENSSNCDYCLRAPRCGADCGTARR